jgi:aldehyde dehydrogenase (NAD+)
VNDENAASSFINSREKPLALYLFSARKSVRQKFLRHTSSGALAVGLTVAHVSVPELPFGGVGESGIGAYHGEASLDAFSHRRAVLRKPSFPDTLRLVYPPFGRKSARQEVIRRVLGN